MISVTEPLTPALQRTKQILFQPFDLAKWLGLGFCAFLANLGSGGGGGGGGGNVPMGNSGGPDLSGLGDTIRDHLPEIILIGSIILLLVFGLAVLLLWLGGRGAFMFIDGIVKNRGAVKAPWSEYRREGNRLMVAKLLLGLATLVALLLALGIGLAIAWPDIEAGRFEGAALTGLLIGIGAALLPGLVLGLVGWVLDTFVVPTMYLARMGVLDAWRVAWEQLVRPELGAVLLFLLLRIALTFAIGMIAMLVMCMTCCLAALPYVGTVILLPLFVFMRSYTLYFIQQYGDTWRFFDERAPILAVDEPPPW